MGMFRVTRVNGSSTGKAFVTVKVVLFGIWLVTLVKSHVEGVLVGFHEVDIWAEGSSACHSVAVVGSIISWSKSSICVMSWHPNYVCCDITSTTSLAQIDIILDCTS